MRPSIATQRRPARLDEPSADRTIHESETPRAPASSAPRDELRAARNRVQRLKWPWPSEMSGD